MAIAHVTPGYDNYLAGLERSKRASKLLDASYLRTDVAGLPSGNYGALVNLRNWAKQQWSRPSTEETTYGAEYGHKSLLEPTRTIVTERDRRNKPHPPAPFMTNNLHYVPGYHNADTTMNREPYRVDLAVQADERIYRNSLREKYNGTRTAAAIRQFEPYQQGASSSYDVSSSAELPYYNEKDRARVRHTLGSIANVGASNDPYGPNLNFERHLDLAGPEERSTIESMIARAGDSPRGPPNMMIPHRVLGTTHSRRQDDIAAIRKVNKPLYRYLPPRGDFLIHPAWPPTLRHHTVPGFTA